MTDGTDSVNVDAMIRGRQRQFTDRTDAIELFNGVFDKQPRHEPIVLNFYGVGGIGKSRLQRELRSAIDSIDHGVSVRLDLSYPTMRHEESALYFLRRCLARDYKIQLPRFDIAFAVHWQHAHPELRMSPQNLPLLEESEVLSSILSIAGVVPVLGAATGLLNILRRAGRSAQQWQRVHSDEDLQHLDDLEPVELRNALTYFFAKDLSEMVVDRGLRCAIFIDAHEALSEDIVTLGAYVTRDRWIRSLALHTPEVVYVICSRDALTWRRDDPRWDDEHLVGCPLGDFSDSDRLDFLASCGIHDELAEEIARASEGVPFYLNLAVDSWEALRPQCEPSIADIGASKAEILRRFIGHVPREQAELLKLLSVPRSWTRPLFAHLVESFQVGFAVSRFDELADYSFTAELPGPRWVMHALMRETLTGDLTAETLAEAHRYLFAYYDASMHESGLATMDRLQCFREACYHAAHNGELDLEWFINEASYLMHRGGWAGMNDVLAELEAIARPARDETLCAAIAAAREYLAAWVLRSEGCLREALPAYEALDLAPLAAFATGIRFQFANVLRECGDVAAAGEIYEARWSSAAADADDPELRALIGIQLADYHYVQGRFVTAREILEPFLQQGEPSKRKAEAMRIMAHILRFNERRRESLALYEEAGRMFTALDDLYGQAAIATNLAEVLAPIEPDQALAAAERAIELNSELGSRLEVGKSQVAQAIGELVLGNAHGAAERAEAALTLQLEVGYYLGQCQARLISAFALARVGVGDARATVKTVTAALHARQSYPTLVLIAHRLLERLGEADDHSQHAVSWAEGAVQWLDDTRASHDRLDRLVNVLMGTS